LPLTARGIHLGVYRGDTVVIIHLVACFMVVRQPADATVVAGLLTPNVKDDYMCLILRV